MSLMELEWHEVCLTNMKRILDNLHNEEKRLILKIKDLKVRVDFYQFQVNEAKKFGKNKFDEEKFRVKKKS